MGLVFPKCNGLQCKLKPTGQWEKNPGYHNEVGPYFRAIWKLLKFQGACQTNVFNGGIQNNYIHYAPLMMSQKESPRNHPWVVPKKFPVWCEVMVLCMLIISQSIVILPCLVNITKESPIINYQPRIGNSHQTGNSFRKHPLVIPSVTSLTEGSVCLRAW